MKKVKYLPLYYEWANTMQIPDGECNGNSGGLCGLFGDHKLFKLMKPALGELESAPIWGYWGCDGQELTPNRFNPLRQNIVLFMAAMNGEL